MPPNRRSFASRTMLSAGAAILLAVLITHAESCSSPAQASDLDVVYGSVDGTPILGSDLSRYEKTRLLAISIGALPTTTPALTARDVALDTVAQRYLTQLPIAEREALSELARHIKLNLIRDYIASSQIDRNQAQPSSKEVSEFIERNPALFSERKVYHYSHYLIGLKQGMSTDELGFLQRRVHELDGEKKLDVEELIAKRGDVFWGITSAQAWRNSEQLDPAFRARLDVMSSQHEKVDSIINTDTLDVLVLNREIADPLVGKRAFDAARTALARAKLVGQRKQLEDQWLNAANYQSFEPALNLNAFNEKGGSKIYPRLSHSTKAKLYWSFFVASSLLSLLIGFRIGSHRLEPGYMFKSLSWWDVATRRIIFRYCAAGALIFNIFLLGLAAKYKALPFLSAQDIAYSSAASVVVASVAALPVYRALDNPAIKLLSLSICYIATFAALLIGYIK